jgi:hypothetical protein
MVHGCAMQFDAAGTGLYLHWGNDPEDPDGRDSFLWRRIGVRQIEVRLANSESWEPIRYDFVLEQTKFGVWEMCIQELGARGFWRSCYPLAKSREPVTS